MKVTKGYINIVSNHGMTAKFDRVEMNTDDSAQLYCDGDHTCDIYESALTEFLTQCHELGIQVIKQAES
jgi:hypothetical protein